MLVDPLSDDPLVVTGSANFSKPSQRINDENMLVIRGNTRVADMYFGEFMHVFDHHYARYIVHLLSDEGRADPEAGYLKAKSSDWLPAHFNPKSYKSKRWKYFVSPKKYYSVIPRGWLMTPCTLLADRGSHQSSNSKSKIHASEPSYPNIIHLHIQHREQFLNPHCHCQLFPAV